MADLEIYDTSGGLVGPRASRRAIRATGRQRECGFVRSTQVDIERDVVVRKVQAIGGIIRQAQTEAALITQTEQALALAVPAASGRLAQISEIGMIGLSETVLDGSRGVGRC